MKYNSLQKEILANFFANVAVALVSSGVIVPFFSQVKPSVLNTIIFPIVAISGGLNLLRVSLIIVKNGK